MWENKGRAEFGIPKIQNMLGGGMRDDIGKCAK